MVSWSIYIRSNFIIILKQKTMKTMKTIIYISSVLLILSSCGSTGVSNSYSMEKEYTTTEDIYSLAIGMSMNQVINKLGVDPFDITYNLTDETRVLIWNYKQPYHEVKNDKHDASSLTSGADKFQGDKKLYVHFKNDKLIRFYSEAGLDQSESLFKTQHFLESINE